MPWSTASAIVVPRVLRELGLAALAFFFQRLESRDHDDEQLDDDARRDVRHDREDAWLKSAPPLKRLMRGCLERSRHTFEWRCSQPWGGITVPRR